MGSAARSGSNALQGVEMVIREGRKQGEGRRTDSLRNNLILRLSLRNRLRDLMPVLLRLLPIHRQGTSSKGWALRDHARETRSGSSASRQLVITLTQKRTEAKNERTFLPG